jgi:hypothetical protein
VIGSASSFTIGRFGKDCGVENSRLITASSPPPLKPVPTLNLSKKQIDAEAETWIFST